MTEDDTKWRSMTLDLGSFSTDEQDLGVLAEEMRGASKALQDRGLVQSCKLIGQVLLDLRQPANVETRHETKQESSVYFDPPFSSKERNLHIFGKSLFDSNEFDRAHYFLKSSSHPVLKFLAFYSKYLGIERRNGTLFKGDAAERAPTLDDAQERLLLGDFSEFQQTLQSSAKKLDPFERYLLGSLQRKAGQKDLALANLLASVQKFSYNWSAWLTLGQCISNEATFASLVPRFPNSLFSLLFIAHWCSERATQIQWDGPIQTKLERFFPGESATMLQLQAQISFRSQDYALADADYEVLIDLDPWNLDYYDKAAHACFTLNKATKLATLSRFAFAIDRYSPVTLCILGNYYAAQQKHEKAVEAFSKAVRLDPTYYEAWTLLGLECTELKQRDRAMAAFRRALTFNPDNIWCWYGLGQAYELVALYSLALYYYAKALTQNPHHPRIWLALADCYGALQRDDDCVQALKRILLSDDIDYKENAALRLAKYYSYLFEHPIDEKVEQKGKKQQSNADADAAAEYYQKFLDIRSLKFTMENPAVPLFEARTKQEVEACLFLAKYHFYKQDFQLAESFCQKSHHFPESRQLMQEFSRLQKSDL